MLPVIDDAGRRAGGTARSRLAGQPKLWLAAVTGGCELHCAGAGEARVKLPLRHSDTDAPRAADDDNPR